ncbi:MAG: hypothetical protein IKS48_12485 [Eubacterium sp.]|nr:hypothetical protein [Eubacterium sp.]
MNKIVLWSLFVLATLVSFCGLYMIIIGSLEMFPTEEQIEKIHLAGWIILLVGAFVDIIVLACIIRKNNKN